MAEYGYLIIRNPGPKTEIIYGGFTASKSDFETPQQAITALKDCQRGWRPHPLFDFVFSWRKQ